MKKVRKYIFIACALLASDAYCQIINADNVLGWYKIENNCAELKNKDLYLLDINKDGYNLFTKGTEEPTGLEGMTKQIINGDDTMELSMNDLIIPRDPDFVGNYSLSGDTIFLYGRDSKLVAAFIAEDSLNFKIYKIENQVFFSNCYLNKYEQPYPGKSQDLLTNRDIKWSILSMYKKEGYYERVSAVQGKYIFTEFYEKTKLPLTIYK